MIALGVDMGIDGGIAVVEMEGFLSPPKCLAHYKMPSKTIMRKKSINFNGVSSLLRELSINYKIEVAFTEKQFVKDGQGYSQAIYGNEGFINGLVFSEFDDLERIEAKEWTSALGVGSDKKKHIAYCNNKFNIDLSNGRHKQDGEADSILIAYYGLKRSLLNA